MEDTLPRSPILASRLFQKCMSTQRCTRSQVNNINTITVMLSPAPSALTGTTLMALLTSLPLPSSAADEIVALHAPFVHPSHLPQSQLGKWLARLNNVVTAREPAAASLAATLVDQDTEGYAAAQYGKGWMGACLGMLAVSITSLQLRRYLRKLIRRLPRPRRNHSQHS